MNTCDACKWWTAPTVWEVGMTIVEKRTADFGLCDNPKCNTDDRTREVNEPPAVDLSYAGPSASDDHNLCFYTGPKFGCIHFEAKS